MRVLGIETSCDETGVAVYDTDRGLLAHALYSQVGLHAEYGGVVPELASRDHVRKLLPLVRQTLADAGLGLFLEGHEREVGAVDLDDGEVGGMTRRFIDCRRLRAPADVAKWLELKTGDAAIMIRRLLLIGGSPVVLDEIWLPGTLFRGLTAEKLADYKGPMYGLFESEYGTRMIRADERIKAVAADEEAARWLKVNPGTPLLSVERVSFTYQDKPVEVRKGRYLTTQWHYHNELG